jgi:hypothetical protein
VQHHACTHAARALPRSQRSAPTNLRNRAGSSARGIALAHALSWVTKIQASRARLGRAMIEDSFYDGLADEMVAKWNRLRAFTGHPGTVGFHHEEILRETLRGVFSPRFQMRSGFVFTAKDNVSQQGDILIVDENYTAPYIFRHGDLVVARPEAVKIVIEVKTTLTRKTFNDSLANLASFQAVADRGAPQNHPATFLFAFDGPRLTPKTMHNWYAKSTLAHILNNYPVMILVLSRGALRFVGNGNDLRNTDVFGHRMLTESDGSFPPKARCLAQFLAAIRNHVDIRVGAKSTAYNDITGPFPGLSRQLLKYGAGLAEVPIIVQTTPKP